jgi:NAD(P)-dependent dehydrogenase (short-subunit alcohol dehydrogenase family)
VQTERKLGVDSKTWLITGASIGLGFALAQYVLEQGDRAVLGARTQRAMSDLVGCKSYGRAKKPFGEGKVRRGDTGNPRVVDCLLRA